MSFVPQNLNIQDDPSPNHNSRGGTRIRAIIMHATAGTNSLGHLQNPAPNGIPEDAVSAHDLIDKDGTIHHLVAYERRAWHGGFGAIPGLIGDLNSLSIGIELENLNTGTDPYPAAQLEAAVDLVRQLADHFNIAREHVVSHAAVALPLGRKSDPKPPAFDLQAFRDRVFGGRAFGTIQMRFEVTHDGVRIRQGPGTGFGIVGQLNAGTEVLIDRFENGESIDGERRWAHLADNRGFITMKFLQEA